MALHQLEVACPRYPQGSAYTLGAYVMVTLPSPSTLRFLQPILSPSILDHLINNDRKLPPEYNLPHTYVEMQVRGDSLPRLGCGEGAALAEAQTQPQAGAPVEGRLSPTWPHLGLACKETGHSAAHRKRLGVPPLPCWSCSRVLCSHSPCR